MFRVDKTESVLLDIRQTKVTCEEGKMRVLKEVDEAFNGVIKKLKIRREQVIKDLGDHYDEQFENISEQENKW